MESPNSKQQTVVQITHDEAWVNTMPGATPMLHVVVDLKIVKGAIGTKMLLQERTPQGINPKILLLDIIPSDLMIYMFNPQHLAFAKNSGPGQYDSIEIYFDSNKLSAITDIPVVQ